MNEKSRDLSNLVVLDGGFQILIVRVKLKSARCSHHHISLQASIMGAASVNKTPV